MAIAYPLSLPATSVPAAVSIRMRSSVGMSMSPFSFAQQVYAHAGDMWEADISLPKMQRADAEEYIAFLAALNGREGSFTLGPDPVNLSPRGTWGGTPLVNGASQTGKTLAVDGFTASATVKKGDWFQLGTGSSSRLHKIVEDGTANGSGQLSLEIWPRLRSSPADNDALTTASPKGVFRLASNLREYSLELAKLYGISFSAIEAI